MMPIEKPQTEPQNTPVAATETETDDGSGTLTEEASADEPIKESATSTSGTPDEALEAALEEAIAEEMATDDAPVTSEPSADETDKTAEGEAIAADTVRLKRPCRPQKPLKAMRRRPVRNSLSRLKASQPEIRNLPNRNWKRNRRRRRLRRQQMPPYPPRRRWLTRRNMKLMTHQICRRPKARPACSMVSCWCW